jgi:AcrR family transcriptional regulator
MKARQYTMTARADAMRETGERILNAARARFAAEYFDDVTLDEIAGDAGVTVQTVIRRFGSKEGLVRHLNALLRPVVIEQRDHAVAGDVDGIVANLVDHYEDMGDLVMLMLRQEERVAAYAEVAALGKQVHVDWARRAFAPWLEERTGAERVRLQAQLVATCDVYVWYLLRRQQGLSRRQTQTALSELLKGVLT